MNKTTEKLRGHIDGLELNEQGDWVLRGWACDVAAPERMLDVEVVEDNEVLGTGRANGYREDVRRSGISDGYCGLAIALHTRSPCPTVSHRGLRAPWHQRTLTLRVAGGGATIVAQMTVQMTALVGHVDRLYGGVVAGWALDLADRSNSVEVEILADGRLIERVVADQWREDLAIRYGTQVGGFAWAVPIDLADGRSHKIAARIAYSSVVLSSSADEITVSGDDLLVGSGMSRVSPSLARHRRYLAHIDQYYRITRDAIGRVDAGCAAYYGHAGQEFASMLVSLFSKVYIGQLNALMTNPMALRQLQGTTLCVMHVNAVGFAEWCLSEVFDRFVTQRITARQPTILSVEAHDREGGLGALNLGRAKELCAYLARLAHGSGMAVDIDNTLIRFFAGHPGFVCSLTPQMENASKLSQAELA